MKKAFIIIKEIKNLIFSLVLGVTKFTAKQCYFLKDRQFA